MEFKLDITILITGIFFTGLTAGLCFTWSNAVTTGLKRVDDLTFLQSFQAMNRSIINPTFLIVFLSPTILLFVNAYLHKQSSPTVFWLFLAAAILFLLGLTIITIFKNVPLNEILDKTTLETLSSGELKDLRTLFETPWNNWHMLRTLSSSASFLLLIIGLVYSK